MDKSKLLRLAIDELWCKEVKLRDKNTNETFTARVDEIINHETYNSLQEYYSSHEKDNSIIRAYNINDASKPIVAIECFMAETLLLISISNIDSVPDFYNKVNERIEPYGIYIL